MYLLNAHLLAHYSLYYFLYLPISSWYDILHTKYLFLLLFLHLVNDTDEVGQLQSVDISNPDTTKWILRDLEPVSRYEFYLRSCTTVGCGPAVNEECTTTLESSEWGSGKQLTRWCVCTWACHFPVETMSTQTTVEFRLSEADDVVESLFQNGIELVEYDICLGSQAFHISM